MIEGKPNRPAPVRVAAEQGRGRLRRLVVEPRLGPAEIEDERVVAMKARQRAQAIGRKKLVLVEHAREHALKPRLVDETDQLRASAPGEISHKRSEVGHVVDEPARPLTEVRQAFPQGGWQLH